MIKLQYFLEDVRFLGALGNNTLALWGNFASNGLGCYSMDLSTGEFEWITRFDIHECLTFNDGERLLVHDLLGKQDLLLINKNTAESHLPLEPGQSIECVVGEYLFCLNRDERSQVLLTLHGRRSLNTLPYGGDYRYLLGSVDNSRLFFSTKQGDLITCIQPLSGEIMWQTLLPESITIDGRLPMQQFDDLLIFYGNTVITEPIIMGGIEHKPREGGEKVRAMVAINLLTGHIVWQHAPIFGQLAGTLRSFYSIDATKNYLYCLWDYGCHGIELSTGKTIYVELFDKKVVKQLDINCSVLCHRQLFGISRRGDLVTFDLDEQRIVQHDKAPWAGTRPSLKNPLVMGDYVVIHEPGYSASADEPGFVSVYSFS